MGFIYRIKNLKNNKCYIGQTINFENRVKQHLIHRGNCLYLKRALKKYGNKCFKIDVVCICFDIDMNKYEIEYIKKFNSLVPNGYNLKNGGNSGGKHHEETKIKIGIAAKGRKFSKESRKKISINNGSHRKEVRDKISSSMKGRQLSKKCRDLAAKIQEKTRKKVGKYDLENNLLEIFESITEAAKSRKDFNKGGISNTCNGIYKSHKGFIWKFIYL